MASITYYSAGLDMANGAIDFDTDSFKAMLVTSSYTPAQSHSKRSDITNEVSGTGYTTGGQAITCSTSRSSGTVSLTWGSVTWSSPVSGFTARYAVIYKSRGGLASADELVCCIDPGSAVAANGQSYTLSIATPSTITIP
jgi:hypothetical protein